MKSPLTPEQKLIEAAKLDGYYFGNSTYDTEECWRNFEGESVKQPDYNSYDAIIPLIQKQSLEIRLAMFEGCKVTIMSTPSQLLDALLLAHGHEL